MSPSEAEPHPLPFSGETLAHPAATQPEQRDAAITSNPKASPATHEASALRTPNKAPGPAKATTAAVATSPPPSAGEPAAQETQSAEVGTLVDVLLQHRVWAESDGKGGARADLTNNYLPGVDLSGVNLRGAFLRKTDLAGADLSFTDLRGACLVQANLQKVNLIEARLRDAALQGANLDGVTELLPTQLGGAHLFGAVLPKHLPELLFHRMKAMTYAAQFTRRLFVALLATGLLIGILVAGTTDLQIVRNSPVLPIPYIGEALPVEGFFMLIPILLLFFYLFVHITLLRLWEQMTDLPSVFPDGQALDRKAAWPLMSLVRTNFRWLNEDRLPPSALQRAMLTAAAYWVAPAVLLLLWARYLTRLDLHASTYHAVLVGAAVVLALWLPDTRASVFRNEAPAAKARTKRKAAARLAMGAAIGAVLFLVSLGIVTGSPHDSDSGQAAGTGNQWAARALWLVGYDPYVDVTEMNLSAKPADWSGKEAEVAAVKGVHLDGRRLRYADAFRAFLVNGRLRNAELQHATLVAADLRGAVLRRANLRFAKLDRARLERADMQEAELHQAQLVYAEASGVNLAYAVLEEAVLVDARLGNATLFAANLRAATLTGSTLDHADLREANLADAKLTRASLREAQLLEARLGRAELREAQLHRAVLTEADLRGADLRGANLQEARLARATLEAAQLHGADLRGVTGLTVDQLCTTAGWRQALLDDELRKQAEKSCGEKP
ncbi:MAG: pentapeptide repeat-containing protein [Candidatus Acidiferrales bacterium]